MRKRILLASLGAFGLAAGLLASGTVPANALASSGGSSSTITSNLGSVTAAYVGMDINQQGLRDPSGGFQTNDYAEGLDIVGTCASGNSSCTQAPEVKITFDEGSCSIESRMCLRVYEYVNGVQSLSGWNQSSGSTWTDDGKTEFPWGEGSASHPVYMGYCISGSKFYVTGTNDNTCSAADQQGYFNDSIWGQTTFGPITKEEVFNTAYNDDGVWTGGQIPSLDNEFQNWADSSGNTLPTPTVTPSQFSVSTVSGTGWTSDGGQDPGDGVGFPLQIQKDSNYCMKVFNGTYQANQAVVIAQCGTANADQSWSFDSATGHLYITHSGTNWCLTDPNDGGNGTKLVIQTCGTGHGQIWTPQAGDSDGGNNNFEAFAEYTDTYCMDNTNGTLSNGNQLQVWNCSTGTQSHQAQDNWFSLT